MLDFSGSSSQAPGFINATRAGLRGGVTGALIPTLGFGIPWNEGLLRPVDIQAPDGLICTALHPAPVGSATVETIWTVTNVVQKALNLLLGSTPEFAGRAQAVSSGTMATFNLGGINQFGERFGLHLLDPLAGGSGAFASHDGINAGGPVAVPVPSVADVESNEQVSPLFYLHRRLLPGSGGAGSHRGGNSAEIALTLRGIDGSRRPRDDARRRGAQLRRSLRRLARLDRQPAIHHQTRSSKMAAPSPTTPTTWDPSQATSRSAPATCSPCHGREEEATVIPSAGRSSLSRKTCSPDFCPSTRLAHSTAWSRRT